MNVDKEMPFVIAGGLMMGLLVLPILPVGIIAYAAYSVAKNKAARQRDIERRTRYHYHYRGD
jgi:hypothetical protein